MTTRKTKGDTFLEAKGEEQRKAERGGRGRYRKKGKKEGRGEEEAEREVRKKRERIL